MTTIKDIISWTETQVGHRLNPDEGIMFGEDDREVTSALLCWIASPQAIKFAADTGCELIIHHETLLMTPPPFVFNDPTDESYLDWDFNRQKIEMLTENNLDCLRIHGSLDEICIYETFRLTLGLEKEFIQEPGNPFRKLYQLKEPVKIKKLMEDLKDCFNLSHLRHTVTDGNRMVRTVAIPWGGMCLGLNIQYLQGLIDLGNVDVMIAGETDNYGARFCKELGIDVIETGHEISEDPGIEKFKGILEKDFGGIRFFFYPTELVFHID